MTEKRYLVLLTVEAVEAFNEYVKRTPTCWLWSGWLKKDGLPYGLFGYDGKIYRAHQVAWVQAKKKNIPASKIVCHKCDVANCVRPSHLWLGTHLENARDRNEKGRYVNYVHLHPECAAKGDRNGSRLHPESRPRGSKHALAKLTETKVVNIRRLYATGNHSYKTLAFKFGVTNVLIGMIVRRKIWKQVE